MDCSQSRTMPPLAVGIMSVRPRHAVTKVGVVSQYPLHTHTEPSSDWTGEGEVKGERGTVGSLT